MKIIGVTRPTTIGEQIENRLYICSEQFLLLQLFTRPIRKCDLQLDYVTSTFMACSSFIISSWQMNNVKRSSFHFISTSLLS